MTKFRLVQLAWMKALDEWNLSVKENERNPENEFWKWYRESCWDELKELQEIYQKEYENNET